MKPHSRKKHLQIAKKSGKAQPTQGPAPLGSQPVAVDILEDIKRHVLEDQAAFNNALTLQFSRIDTIYLELTKQANTPKQPAREVPYIG